MHCTRCDGSGFLNLEQVDAETLKAFDESGNHQIILDWIKARNTELASIGGCSCHIAPPCSWCMLQHDVSVCDCCGDGEGWHGTPGEHDRANPNDPCGCR
jgi:hypothetical protein